MMAASHIFRLAKLNGLGKIRDAARHNRRMIQRELGANPNIDPSKMHLNYCLAGAESPEAVLAEAKRLLEEAGIEKLRKNGVAAVEAVFSLPISSEIDTEEFFRDCLEWSRLHFGCPILSFDVHLDESFPHAHALILPLKNGRMNGSDLVGGKHDLLKHQSEFHRLVGSRHGLQKPLQRLAGKAKQEIEKKVLDALCNDPIIQSSIWGYTRDCIRSDPAPFASLLGIRLSRPKQVKSFVQIMTSRGRGSCKEP